MIINVSDSPMGRNIRYLRQKKYISCRKLARQCGMPYSALHLIERGILRDIDYNHLKNLCKALCASVEELIETDCKL